MLLAGRRWTDLSAEEFYAVTYTLMMEEAGGRARLEEVLQEWSVNRDMLSATSTTDVAWNDADARALANLGKME